jgi:16S rRNA (guanine527-N7)-methyltransferase
VNSQRIAELLNPFTGGEPLAASLLDDLNTYLEILLRWNARVNLTAVRDADGIVTRHFGESLLVGRALRDLGALAAEGSTLVDVGSGAGFPGVPIKLLLPQIGLTLIEANHKKATFLREVIRGLKLEAAQVVWGRAETVEQCADVVTLRAVEQFDRVLPVAAKLVAPGGRLCLLVGTSQIFSARRRAGEGWTWREPVAIPQSSERAVLIGERVESAAPASVP